MEKIYEFKDLNKGLATFRVLHSKLQDLLQLTPSPSFWYDINLSTNDKGYVVVFLNCGGNDKQLKSLDYDIEMS